MKRWMGARITVRKTMKIVVSGTESGVGTTHFALSLANVCASREHKKTLYIEVGKNGYLASMRTEATFAAEGQSGYEKSGVCYLPRVTEDDARRLLCDAAWDVIICDVTETEREDALFDLCDRRMVLCSVKPWHYPVFQQSMKRMIRSKNKERVSFCSFGMLEPDRKRAEAEFDVRLRGLPYVGNPFHMTHKEAAAVAAFL